MADWKLEKTIENPSGNRSVDLLVNPTRDLYRYHVREWMAATEEDQGALGDGYWMDMHISGYFGSLSECEADARSSVTWLKQNETGPS